MKKISFIILSIIVLSMVNGYRFYAFCSEEDAVKINYVSDGGIDLDGDGLFNYLAIRIEANISVPGIYLFESGELVDPSNMVIPITSSKAIFMDVGLYNFSFFIDGRMIHSLGLNPRNVSYLGVISEDNQLADFLTKVPLSREYDFTEFDGPPDYEVGIAEGGWMKYNVLNLFSSTDSSASAPEDFPSEILVKVENIEDRAVTIRMFFYYTNGKELNETVKGYLEMESGIFPFIIPADLSVGDPFAQESEARIDDERTEDLFGSLRKVNHYYLTFNRTQSDSLIKSQQEYFWEKGTGVLVRSWINLTMSDLLTGYKMYNNVSFVIVGTNLIPQKTSIEIAAPMDVKLGNPFNINATLLDFNDQGVRDSQIIFKTTSDDKEIGVGVTDSDGNVIIEFNPEKAKRYRIRAIFLGAEGFLASENSVEITVQRNNNSVISLTGLIVLFIGVSSLIVLYIKKKGLLP